MQFQMKKSTFFFSPLLNLRTFLILNKSPCSSMIPYTTGFSHIRFRTNDKRIMYVLSPDLLCLRYTMSFVCWDTPAEQHKDYCLRNWLFWAWFDTNRSSDPHDFLLSSIMEWHVAWVCLALSPEKSYLFFFFLFFLPSWGIKQSIPVSIVREHTCLMSGRISMTHRLQISPE